jgi:hypothetical protein
VLESISGSVCNSINERSSASMMWWSWFWLKVVATTVRRYGNLPDRTEEKTGNKDKRRCSSIYNAQLVIHNDVKTALWGYRSSFA